MISLLRRRLRERACYDGHCEGGCRVVARKLVAGRDAVLACASGPD